MFVEQLASTSFLNYADDFVPILTEFIEQNPAFLETEIGRAMAQLLLAAVVDGRAPDPHVHSLLGGLIAVAQRCHTAVTTGELVELIGRLLGDTEDQFRVMSGWALFAAAYLAGREIAGMEQWLAYLAEQPVFVASDRDIHILAVRKLAGDQEQLREQLLALINDLETRQIVDLSASDECR
jgi:hypothetical protein